MTNTEKLGFNFSFPSKLSAGEIFMEIKEILSQFNHLTNGFPREAVAAAIMQQEAITPFLLDILQNIITNYKSVEPYQMDYIFALYLLAKFHEKKAFHSVIALASLPREWPEVLLGDCITEDLPCFIFSTFNGDIEPIKVLIENPVANEWSRNAALRSLLGLIAAQQLSREEVIDYLRYLFHSPLIDDKGFATSLVNTVSDLYPEELLPEINTVFKQEKVDICSIDKEWVDNVLAEGKELCLAKNIYKDSACLPIDDVERAMSWMSIFQFNKYEMDDEATENDDWSSNFDIEPVIPHIRVAPKIGRNDPCPCGSGKKYKKCCLL